MRNTTRQQRSRSIRFRGAAALLTTAAVITGTAGNVQAGSRTSTTRRPAKSVEQSALRYIVRAQAGKTTQLADAVGKAGAVVGAEMNSVDSLVAYLTPAQLKTIKASPSYLQATVDSSIATLQAATNAAANDTSMQTVNAAIGAPAMWAKGYTGKGLCVAVVDTGIAPVPGLDDGRVVNGIDLSLDAVEAPDALGIDAFGHGTHMASIIGGRDRGAALNDPNAFVGVAPETCLLNIKVGAYDGATDVSQVIAAIDWAVTNKSTYNIRVLNLSYGTSSTQKVSDDPLAWAAEVAWRNGIVVVAAAGNDGNKSALTNPANNSAILAVSAADTATDTVALFANGSGKRLPDLSAPGTRIRGLRVPGSLADQQHPAATPGDRYLRGSGTSQATAVVSGAVALLIQAYPDATPDEIKAALRTTAEKLASKAGGKGLLDIAAAADEFAAGVNKAKAKVIGAAAALATAKTAEQAAIASGDAKKRDRAQKDVVSAQAALTKATDDDNAAKAAATTAAAADLTKQAGTRGRGSLEGSRGGSYISTDGKKAVSGELDALGGAWSPATWAPASANGKAWNGRSWTGRSWTGGTWTGRSWTGRSWNGRSWVGRSWVGRSWSGTQWSDAVWTGSLG
jgi:serine protease AprX